MHVKKRLCYCLFCPHSCLKFVQQMDKRCVFSVTFFFCLWFNALNTNFTKMLEAPERTAVQSLTSHILFTVLHR